ncbi:Delta(24(24(1)))-sterol reductase [Fusarium oxysporum f. sp. albedinis]|nr:Delta(24(24(1)))-sterol reductase [Fusarium oxysporum f. sp. albedinis]
MALSSHQRIRTVPGSCWTCKNRRILCDLTKPVCRRCIEVGSSCQYSQVTLKRPLRLVPHVPAAFQPIAFPAGLSSTLEEKAFSYFHRRLWPLLTAVDDQITFPLDPVINNQVVRVVICLLAESHRFLQDRRNNPPDTVRKRRECIEAVNKEIDRCSSDINANMQPLLFAILLLYFYEGYIECPWWSHSTLIHQNGIQATITRMGGLQRVLKSGHTSLHVLLSLFATAELTTRMLRGGVPSISPRSWRLFSPGPAWWQEHLPDNTPSSEPCLGNIMEYMSDIVCYRQFLIDNEALPSTELKLSLRRVLLNPYSYHITLSSGPINTLHISFYTEECAIYPRLTLWYNSMLMPASTLSIGFHAHLKLLTAWSFLYVLQDRMSRLSSVSIAHGLRIDWITLKPKMDKNWDNCLQTLEGHSRHGVMSVALSPDNQLIASGGRDRTVKIWDITTGVCRHTLEGHDDEIHSITFLPDGQSLAAASNTIKIWDTKTELCLRTLEGHEEPVSSVASSPDGHLKTGKYLKNLKEYSGRVYLVAFLPNNQRLVSGSTDSTAHDEEVMSVAFSPDSKRLAAVSVFNGIKIWDAATGSSLPVLEISARFGIAIAFSADGKRLALDETESVIKLFDAETGTIMQTLKGFGGPVTSVAFTADGQHLVSGSEDGLVKIWAVSIDACPLTVEDHDKPASSIAISADGLQVISGSIDATIKIWDTETGRYLQTLKGPHKIIKVWDTITGTCLYTLMDDGRVCSVAFSADDQYLISGSSRNTTKIWDIATGKCLYTFEHNDKVALVALLADSRYLATGSDDRTIRIWKIREDNFKMLQGHNQPISSVALSVDSQYLASGSYNKELYTDIGILDLKVPNLTPNINAKSIGITALPGPDWSSHCINIDGEWIEKYGENALWLPSNYRPTFSAVFKSTVAAGYDSGRVLIIRFS